MQLVIIDVTIRTGSRFDIFHIKTEGLLFEVEATKEELIKSAMAENDKKFEVGFINGGHSSSENISMGVVLVYNGTTLCFYDENKNNYITELKK